ncbi:hypothetical protein ABK040_010205 [Willaertia magna]
MLSNLIPGLEDNASSLNSGDIGNDDFLLSEEERMKKDVDFIINQLTNERSCPELLPGGYHLENIINRLNKKIKDEEENMLSLDQYSIEYSLKSVEIHRIKYLITSLIKIRVIKLEEMCEYINRKERENFNGENMNDSEILSLLKIVTPTEWNYLQKFCNLRNTFFEKSFINHLTNIDIASKGLGKENIIPIIEPNWFKFVFCYITEDLGTVTLKPFDSIFNDEEDDDETELTLMTGTVVVLQYRMVRQLILENKAKLI